METKIATNKSQTLLDLHLTNKQLGHAYLVIGRPYLDYSDLYNRFLEKYTTVYGVQAEVLIFDTAVQGSLDELREVITWSTLSSFNGAHKIVILKNFQQLSIAGSNLLLKTLEEPTGKALFLLLSDNWKILPTIRSRCTIFSYRGLESNLIDGTEELEELNTAFVDAVGSKSLAHRLLLVSRLAESSTEDVISIIYKYAQKLAKNLNTEKDVLNMQLANVALSQLQGNFNTKLTLQNLLINIKI